MKQLLLLLTICASLNTRAQETTAGYVVPDSVRALAYYAELPLSKGQKVKKGKASISNDTITLTLEKHKRYGVIAHMNFPNNALVKATGLNGVTRKGGFTVYHAGPDTGTYKLMLVKAFDTAQHISLWSGYVFLPAAAKWKLIGTVQTGGEGYMRLMRTSYTIGKRKLVESMANQGFGRANGSWRSIGGQNMPAPYINWFNEADSAERAQAELNEIRIAKELGRIGDFRYYNGIYYKIDRQGSGKSVQVTDTLTVHYKGYIFADSSVFDQTAPGKTARFPLNRLIRGWQIGLPQVNEGGKITLIIPSGLAYSIRTRSPKIPPNSVLVFEIEVVKREEAGGSR